MGCVEALMGKGEVFGLGSRVAVLEGAACVLAWAALVTGGGWGWVWVGVRGGGGGGVGGGDCGGRECHGGSLERW